MRRPQAYGSHCLRHQMKLVCFNILRVYYVDTCDATFITMAVSIAHPNSGFKICSFYRHIQAHLRSRKTKLFAFLCMVAGPSTGISHNENFYRMQIPPEFCFCFISFSFMEEEKKSEHEFATELLWSSESTAHSNSLNVLVNLFSSFHELSFRCAFPFFVWRLIKK